MAGESAFPLFALPVDMQRLIVAELPPWDLKRFARVSRAARALAAYRFASAEHGRRLCAEILGGAPGAAPPVAVIRGSGAGGTQRIPLSQVSPPDLVWLGYRLGFYHWRPGRSPVQIAMLAAHLLEWSATFERGGLREGGASPGRGARCWRSSTEAEARAPTQTASCRS